MKFIAWEGDFYYNKGREIGKGGQHDA